MDGLSREGNGSPLQYSCLENFMDREDWQATVLQKLRYDWTTEYECTGRLGGYYGK